MEWSWRTVLIIIGLMVMAAILVDGFRRMRRARAEALRLDVNNEFQFPEEGHNPELPGGGFRVVGDEADDDYDYQSPAQARSSEPAGRQQAGARHEEAGTPFSDDPHPAQAEYDSERLNQSEAEADTAADNEPDLPSFSARDDEVEPVVSWEDDVSPARVVKPTDSRPHPETIKDLDIPESSLIPKARPVNLDEEFPVLLDVEELGDDEVQPEPSTGDLFARMEDNKASVQDEADNTASVDTGAPADDMLSDELTDDEYPQEEDLEDEVAEVPEALSAQPVNYAAADAEKLSDRPVPDLVLEIHCIAHDEHGFDGKDILYLFNSCDLRFGEKDIFHRFEQADGRGNIQFSVAQSFEPGIFVPAAMSQQHFRGLSFFMSLPGANRPQEAYEAMSEMARVIARNLKADLFDGARSALTTQTIEHDRQQIMDYERRQKLARKKQGLK
ncbi:MAG: hypothetical protein CMH98_16635 [Oceanospirillaceae bacterium]|nr:hypothetical protein [Oceanospirillaceae bacterium]|tara:strand:+ start:45372 stop:46703 length:1332 start_codon:yes stop_codon:yes gene_type:complete